MNKPVRILLVEDEIITAMQMKAELQKSGFTVLGYVATGEKALAFACEERPDLILMDINLAGKIDGIDAAVSIQAVYPVPVIFMTGYEDSSMRERAEKTHPLQFLVKPVLMPSLVSIIGTYFNTTTE